MTTEILLTNDDGIDAVGIGALYDALATDYEVTVVAPATNQSGVGGERSWWDTTVEFDDHELGYAVDGTPADCVAVGLTALEIDPDLVVSGCNHGPNIGSHILGRSGTVGAAMEAAYLDVPGIALSLYDRADLPVGADVSRGDFSVASDVARRLVSRYERAGLPADADVLNVNVPAADDAAGPADELTHRLTEPARGFDVLEYEPTAADGGEQAEQRDDDGFVEPRGEAGLEFRDRFWRELLDFDVSDDVGSDRRAVVDGEVSVSPLSTSNSTLSSGGGMETGAKLDRI